MPRLPLLLIAIAALALPAPRPFAATPTLVHHWNFDEGPDWHDTPFTSPCTNSTTTDIITQSPASLINMGPENWISGKQYSGLEFTNPNQFIQTQHNLAQTLGHSASLSFWVKTTHKPSSPSQPQPGITGTSTPNSIQWGTIDHTGRIGISIHNQTACRSTLPITDNHWHHITLTRDEITGTLQVYVDATLSASTTATPGPLTSAFSSLAQIEHPSQPAHFQGRLDQIHVFNDVLPQDHVSLLHTNHAPKLWPASTDGVNHRPFTTTSALTLAYDVERHPISIHHYSQPSHGSVTPNPDGSFTFTPEPSFSGTDSFEVTITDGQGGFYTAPQHVNILQEPPGGGGLPTTQFINFSPLQSNGSPISHSGWRIPRTIDWNHDNLPDLLLGTGGYVLLYLNTGTPSSPSFSTPTRLTAGRFEISSGSSTSPFTLADMTGDNSPDLILVDAASNLRIYPNTNPTNSTPAYTSYSTIKTPSGTTFTLPDKRFDIGDYNHDGLPDLVTGTFSGSMELFLNVGTPQDPRFNTSTPIISSSYNLYPRLHDLNHNGTIDLLRGINWGDIRYWHDPHLHGLDDSLTLSITNPDGSSPDLHALTDGAIIDFADFNADGITDLVLGGHANSGVYIAYGQQQSIANSLAEIEAIYDAHSNDLGPALSANNNALLNQLNTANQNLVSHAQFGTLTTRETLFNSLSNHVAKYAFLRYQTLDTTTYHHVPSIALQNWVILQHTLPDTPTHRTNVANAMGLTRTARTIFLHHALALGDNAKSIPAAYNTIHDYRLRHPRALFPDAVLTIDQLYGDGRGGFIWTPNSTKNTFGDWAVRPSNEWASDLTRAIERELGRGSASGDYFTFVMGHEMTHSLDAYVRSRPNQDLYRRWGLTLSTAAGPDVLADASGWYNWDLTKQHFQSKGLWDGNSSTWSTAWENYWTTGPGTPFRSLSFMRGNIDWFLNSPQESLATQANHYWANAPGRIIGAIDRFSRATTPELQPLKANINEVITFIDFQSAGLNRINLVETKSLTSPQRVQWIDHFADLQRNDSGYITRLTVDNRTYTFDYNDLGIVTNVLTWNNTPPALQAQATTNGVILQLHGIPGQTYQLEYQDPLTTPSPWLVLSNIPALPQSPLTLTDSPNSSPRLYRILTLPQ
jgi:hypothetical protein